MTTSEYAGTVSRKGAGATSNPSSEPADQLLEFDGKKMSRLRKGKKISQAEFARMMSKHLGYDISNARVNNWETGNGIPTFKFVSLICLILGCSFQDLGSPSTRAVHE